MLLKLCKRLDAVLELPFPVIPESGRHVLKVSRRVGDELFWVFAVRGRKHLCSLDEKLRADNTDVNGGTWPCAPHRHNLRRLPSSGLATPILKIADGAA